MAMQVEIRLRVPTMKVPALDANGYPLDMASMRFRKTIDVERTPKPNEEMALDTQAGAKIPMRVVRSDWNESLGMFVVSCQYANRSITAEEYNALSADPSWDLKHLLE